MDEELKIKLDDLIINYKDPMTLFWNNILSVELHTTQYNIIEPST